MFADLVLEGDGVKGIAPVGVISVLEQRGYHFRRVAGTSAAPGQPAWDWAAYRRTYRSSQSPVMRAVMQARDALVLCDTGFTGAIRTGIGRQPAKRTP